MTALEYATRKGKKYYRGLLKISPLLETKYFNVDNQFEIFSKIFYNLNQLDKIGFDFGCGISIPIIISKYLPYQIIGIDIKINNEKSDYLPLQNKIIEDGEQIHYFDTSQYPWKYPDNYFDFGIASWSINKDFTLANKKGKSSSSIVENRIKEIARIIKPGGKLFIRGGEESKVNHYQHVINAINKIKANIKVFHFHEF